MFIPSISICLRSFEYLTIDPESLLKMGCCDSTRVVTIKYSRAID